MERFKELNYEGLSRYNKDKKTKISMFVPGVNSGMYDKALCINVVLEEPGFFKIKRTFGELKLYKKQIEELRDECNKILSL